MDNFPEKILLVQDDNTIKDYWVLENLTDCKDMEYIRKDVFINKACKWLEDNLVQCWFGDFLYVQFKHRKHQEKENVLADFRKAMEE